MAQGKITPKQQEILDYIKSQILERGFPPAVRDICEAVHLKSTSSVHSHLETLEKNGYIKRDPTKPRAIEIFGIFTKPFSLMIRLFANMMAGHAAILSLISIIFITANMGPLINGSMGFVAVAFGIFMTALELLVAFIQAYVFTMLSAVFIGLSRTEEMREEKEMK